MVRNYVENRTQLHARAESYIAMHKIGLKGASYLDVKEAVFISKRFLVRGVNDLNACYKIDT